jgi:diguanylate cyclase (GGDEF)-like protein
MHVDLDFFKEVNDTLGHAAGDTVLQHVAKLMVQCTRQNDTVARVGGDEFVLIFEGLVDRIQLSGIARRLISSIEEPIPFGDRSCNISASAGTALSSAFAAVEDGALLLHQADVALYAAKNAGRARHFFYQPGMEGAEAS